MKFSFREGSVYHVHSDLVENDGSVSDEEMNRISLIEWSKEQQGFEIRWHPTVIQEFRLLLEPGVFKTKKAAVDAEVAMIERIQNYPHSESVFDAVIDVECSLDFYKSI